MLTTVVGAFALQAVITVAGLLTLRWAFAARWARAGMAGGVALLLCVPLVAIVGHFILAALCAALVGAAVFTLALAGRERKRGSDDD